MEEKGLVPVNKINTKSVLSPLLLSMIFISAMAQAQKVDIEIPNEELPSERVMPKLDSPAAVLSRKLTFSKRFEARFFSGWFLDEPFYQNQYFGFNFLYNLDEINGVGIKFQKYQSGISDYAKQVESTKPVVQFSKAPGPDSSIVGTYEYRAFYGKINFSQNSVVQFVMAGELEAGFMKYGNRSLMRLGVAGAQKFFFTKNWGAQIDLRFLVHQAVDPNSVNFNTNPNPAATDFSTKTRFSNELNLSAIYLF